jgi:hypothetical protein
MKRLKMKITISVVIYLMFLLKLKLFFNANITVNKLSTRHVHTLVPEDTHVHTLVPEDTHVHTLVPDDTYKIPWAAHVVSVLIQGQKRSTSFLYNVATSFLLHFLS